MSCLNIIFKEITYGSAGYRETLELRRKILRRPLGLDFTENDLKDEDQQIHIAGYCDNKMITCMILAKVSDEEVKMRQLAVDEPFQSRGIGNALVHFGEKLAGARGFKRISCHAREKAIPFYQKLGYEKIEGPFLEVSIPHFKMKKEILVEA